MYIFCYKAPTVLFRIFFACFLGGFTTRKLYIIHGQILYTVVKYGVDIVQIFENPSDLPQPVVICVRVLSAGFLLFSL